MTFLVDEIGDAYQKDLGATTTSNAIAITSFRADNTWDKVE